MRQISEELMDVLRNDTPGPNSLSNTALMYMNRQTFEEFKQTMQAPDPPTDSLHSLRPFPAQLFGIPVMLYHGIPDGRWELVRRSTGESITSGNVWKKESGALCGHRWLTYSGGLVPDTREHQCIIPASHYPNSHCVCECGQASAVPSQ